MAKRMFSEEVTRSDAFLDMPAGSQLLYFHLGLSADDDGFLDNPKSIMRTIGASEDEYKILIAKKFVITFDNGICVIKHWRINNYIRKQIYKETKYIKEKSLLFIRANGAYSMNPQNAMPVPKGHFTVSEDVNIDNVDVTSTQRRPSIDKYRLDKNSISTQTPEKKFTPPTLEEVSAYCKERNNKVDAEKFVNFYESKGWMIGKNKMKSWNAAVRTWEKESGGKTNVPKNVLHGADLNDRISRITNKTQK
jgi:hypothetical protein